MNRSRQKRTMAGARDWGVALETLFSSHMGSSTLVRGTSDQLALVAHGQKLPLVDGWGNPFRIEFSKDSYLVQSAARDGTLEAITKVGTITTYDEDIVFADGTFVRYP